nr:ST.25 [Starmerella bombicola]
MQNIDPGYIPGTDQVLIRDLDNSDNIVKDGDIVLVPQPTISPNDPLTWSQTRKYVHLLLVLLFTGLTAATSNSCGSAEDGIQAEYPHISDNVFNTGDGLLFLGIGWWTLLSAPSVYLYGSRIGYLVGVLLSIIGNAWYANVKNVGDVVWSQLFIGASESVTEAVAQLSITQVFYQHTAQHYIGLYVMAISVGTFVGPLIGGVVANNINWHWVGYVAVICSGFTGVLLLFFLEETYFDRAHFQNKYASESAGRNLSGEEISPHQSWIHRSSVPNSLSDSGEDHRRFIENEESTKKDSALPQRVSGAEFAEKSMASIRPDIVDEKKQDFADQPRSYWQRIALITPAVNLKGTGFKQYFKRVFLYLKVLAFPPVLYSGLQWGAQDAWLSFYIDLEDNYYYGPPWNYSDLGVGLMNIPCLIGAVLGCLYGAYFSDWFVMWCARRNGGIREAETRLWCLLPAGLISPAGMFLLGVGTERKWAWYAPYVGLGLIGFGWGCCGDLSMSYLVDCYPEMVLEGMVGVSLINNNIAMVFSFIVDRWMEAIGPEKTFISIGVLNFFLFF